MTSQKKSRHDPNLNTKDVAKILQKRRMPKQNNTIMNSKPNMKTNDKAYNSPQKLHHPLEKGAGNRSTFRKLITGPQTAWPRRRYDALMGTVYIHRDGPSRPRGASANSDTWSRSWYYWIT